MYCKLLTDLLRGKKRENQLHWN